MIKPLKKSLKRNVLLPLISLIPIKKYRRMLRNKLESSVNHINFEEIRNNYTQNILRIRQKHGKIKVAFLVSENQKWNCQSVYDEMASSSDFEPVILITGIYSSHYDDLGKYYTSVKENYDFFANKGMHVEYAYDIGTHEFLSLDRFKPDIIFYQQPWAIHPIQDIPETSKFALSCYVPYGICVIDCPTDYDQNFHRMLWHHYAINEILYNHFKSKCHDLPDNYKIVGHPKLDAYTQQSNAKYMGGGRYIIYAPHHSFAPSHLNFATFKWNGKFILEYAKAHPELKFVFKPHPQLKTRLIVRKIMSEKEVNNYYDEWKKIAVFCDTANYFDLFKQSQLMITDCSSFLAEYFPSTHTVINLKNKNSISLNPFGQAITDCYYKVYNIKELKQVLKMLLEDGQDPLREKRMQRLKELNLLDTPSSTRIISLLRETLKEKVCV